MFCCLDPAIDNSDDESRNRNHPGSLQCSKCHSTIGVPPGSSCVVCPRCGAQNGVPYQPSGYHQHVGQISAPSVGGPAPPPSGRKRALLVGCNYPGTRAELNGCINDVRRMHSLLTNTYAFSQGDIRVLTDDGRSPDGLPTRQNMEQGMRWLVAGAQPGDVLFFHFSGHGGQEEDPTYTEEDGYDETLCPTDFQLSGQIVDTAVFDTLCAPLPSGVKVTAVLDCCHSGTGLDLAFTLAGRWTEEANPCHCAADVQLISGCEDAQCSADASDRYGAPAGALTSALCDCLEQCPVQPYPQLLRNVHSHLQRNGHSQRPQLTSSQAFDVNAKNFNPCGDIAANSNPTLGRHFRKAKHPRRDFGGAFEDMLDMTNTGLAMAMLPSVLDMGGFGIAPGVDLFGGGGGMTEGFGGADARGRRLLAARRCKRNELVLRERPLLLWGPDARAEVVAAGGALLEEAGKELGNWDALAARAALRRLPQEDRTRVQQLEGAASELAADALLAAQALRPELLEALGGEDGVAEYAEMAGIIAANATENSDSRRALYPTLSMANHSCAPNAAWRTVDAASGEKELVCIARGIAAGEEVCISYLPERDLFQLDREGRQRRLQDSRSFACLCDRCAASEREGDSAGEKELAALSTELLEGGALRSMPRDKDTAIQQCKDLGRQLRRLDTLWPVASALKASLWTSFVELLCDCGAPQALKEGAAQRALEESQPCLGARAWTEQARRLQERLKAGPRPARAGPEAPPPEEPVSAEEARAAEASEKLD